MTRDEALSEIKHFRSLENVIFAMRIIAKIGTVSDIFTLMPIATNNSANASIRKLATDAICSIIKESLITKFNELTPDMRQKLAKILQTLDPKIINDLSKDLFSNDTERRLSALQMLGILRRHPRVKDIAVKLLQDKDTKIRATAITLLGKMMGPNDQHMVLMLLGDDDKRVRANTVEALESMGNQLMIPVLIPYRKDPNNRIRGNVLKALYNLGQTDIEEDLLDMLTSTDPLQKASALWVITQIKYNSNKKVIDAAGACLLCDNKMVYRNAEAALTAVGTPRCMGYINYLGRIFRYS
ncbi:MAG: HEAT repeat domain-containing protein [Chitinispirillales bacterium]|jgi:HEAT repeat protein|nr:HEAT repeat domain-containing protein [Chitinispirillales bacterium]